MGSRWCRWGTIYALRTRGMFKPIHRLPWHHYCVLPPTYLPASPPPLAGQLGNQLCAVKLFQSCEGLADLRQELAVQLRDHRRTCCFVRVLAVFLGQDEVPPTLASVLINLGGLQKKAWCAVTGVGMGRAVARKGGCLLAPSNVAAKL